jgi:hypothetical protein
VGKSIWQRGTRIAIGAALLLAGLAPAAHAATAALSWDANTEPDIGGYIAFWGTSPGSYDNQADVGNVTSYPITGLSEGTTYYFAVKAYDTSTNTSAFSAEVSLTIPTGGGSTPDTTPPSVTSLTTTSATTVVVVFSEPVDPATAEDPSNYVIDGGAVAVTDAVLGGDGVTVRLTTDAQVVDSLHTLTVTGVADLAVPPNAAADDVSYQVALDLEVNVVAPAGYDVFPVAAGDMYYVDRPFTVDWVPAEYQNAQWVRTGNDDKAETADSFLTFTVSQDAIVYVAFDRRAASFPDWLTSAFVPTGEGPASSDDASPFTMWARDVPAGDVVLGGNKAAGAVGGSSNYVVLVRPMSADVAGDSDGDLMPDSWESAMGLNASLFDAHDDPDGDGLTNLQEAWLGTDPLVAATTGAGNTAPTVTLDGSVVGVAGSEVVLDGSGADDADGDSLTVQWRQTAGPAAVTVTDADLPTARFTPTETGVYAFTMTVSDGKGGIAVATTDVEVYEDLLASTITALGANLVVSGGSLTGAVLSIPVGAMDKTYAVGVGSTGLPKALPSGDVAVSAVVHFSPSDMPLLGMATIRVPYTRNAAIGFDNLDLLRYDPEADAWETVTIGRDLTTTVEASVDLLGTFVVVQKGGGSGGTGTGGTGGTTGSAASGGGCTTVPGAAPGDMGLLLLLLAAAVLGGRRMIHGWHARRSPLR